MWHIVSDSCCDLYSLEGGEGIVDFATIPFSIRIGDRVLCIWIFCIALYSVFNNLLTSPLSNCSFLGIWYAARILRDYSRKKREGTLEAFYEQSQC